MYGNGRPTISNKKMVRVCLALTVLAWATQVLFKQWGYGAELPPAARSEPAARPAGPVVSGGAVGTNVPAVADQSDDLAPAPVARPAGRGPTSAERFVAAQSAQAVQAAEPTTAAPAAPAERFLTARPAGGAVGAALELRSEATVVGTEVRLKQIARWSQRDAEFFRSADDLVLARLDAKTPYKAITLGEVRRTLADAGVNVVRVRFAGPTTCTVNRSDAKPEAGDALANWIDAKEKGTLVAEANLGGNEAVALPAPLPSASASDRTTGARANAKRQAADEGTGPLQTGSVASPASTAPTAALAAAADRGAVRTLRDLLTEDLSVRLRVPAEQLQLTFNPKDERALNLCEPQFKFNLEGQRVRNLGDVAWDVTVLSGGSSQKLTVGAIARAWQGQVVVNRPLTYRSVIRREDLIERRALADRLPDEPLLTLAQAVDQQAGRDLKPGTVLTGRMVEAVPLCKNGDLVTINLAQGGVRVTSVARAKEGGSFGQRIQVKNESTNETYSVVLTGPQEATLGEPAAR